MGWRGWADGRVGRGGRRINTSAWGSGSALVGVEMGGGGIECGWRRRCFTTSLVNTEIPFSDTCSAGSK